MSKNTAKVLTLTRAKILALREFGTCRGLEKDPGNAYGYYAMRMGNLKITIRMDTKGRSCIVVTVSMDCSGCINQLYDMDTFEHRWDLEEADKKEERRERFETWVSEAGPEKCHKAIDDFWNGR